MSDSSPKESFDSLVSLFNTAIEEKNTSAAIYLGKELITIADKQCARDSINPQMKKYFSENKNKVKIHLDNINRSFDVEEKKWFSHDVPSYTLGDVIGLDNVTDEFMVNVLAPASPKYIHVYKKYRGSQFGAQILLYGPPGTGKTFLVKCLAGHLGCHIAVVQTKEILANLVGDAEKNMAAVFEEAGKYDKCIIFFDEIDAIAASRDDDESRHTKGVLTTMLTYMDGFKCDVSNGQLRIIIAATNRPWILDPALKRGGRFETQIYVSLPNIDAREQFVERAFGKDKSVKNRVDVPCSEDVSIRWLAEKLDGMAGADINAVCRQIINRPLRREIEALYHRNESKADFVTREDCEAVIGKYINGITEETKLRFDAYSAGMELADYLTVCGLERNK